MYLQRKTIIKSIYYLLLPSIFATTVYNWFYQNCLLQACRKGKPVRIIFSQIVDLSLIESHLWPPVLTQEIKGKNVDMAEEFSIVANNDRREDDLVNVKQEDSEEEEAATEEEWRSETRNQIFCMW